MALKARKQKTPTRRKRPDPAVLDLEHLHHYTMESLDLERELIGLFGAQLPSLIEQLKTASVPYDWKLATHTLKGSARAIGANRIGTLAAQLETLGLAAADCERARVMAELDQAVADFAKAVAAYYR